MWVLSLVDYYMATGDDATLTSLARDAETILDGCLANFNSTTSPADLRWSGWDDRLGSGFVDVNQTPEARRFYWMTTLRAAAAFAAAAGHAGGALQPAATKYSAAVTDAVARLRAAGGAAWYATGQYGLHAMSQAILGGWTTAEERDATFALFNDSARICSFSNYDSGYILSALGASGHIDFATAMLRQCWGRQITAGATCWWESTQAYDAMLATGVDMDLVPGAQTSACHAWGSTPTTWMPANLLGVTPSAPGYKRFNFAPAVGQGGQWLSSVSGSVPTPLGAIDATAKVNGTSGTGAVVTLTLHHPTGTLASVQLRDTLPGTSMQLVHVYVDGVQLPPQVNLPLSDTSVGGRNEHTVVAHYSRVDTASSFDASLAGGTADRPMASDYPPFGPPVWPSTVVIDNTTHGGWVDNGKIGLDGYILFGFDGREFPAPPTDRAKLPTYVTTVTWPPAVAQASFDAGSGGIAALQDPSQPQAARHVGSLFLAGAGALYGLWVDILLPAEHQFKLSVYATDTSPTPPGSIILRIEDYVSRNALAPDVLMRQYVPPPAYGGVVPPFNAGGIHGLEGGLYASYVVNASARVRIYCNGGCYASISAIFFDPVA